MATEAQIAANRRNARKSTGSARLRAAKRCRDSTASTTVAECGSHDGAAKPRISGSLRTSLQAWKLQSATTQSCRGVPRREARRPGVAIRSDRLHASARLG